MYIKFYVGQCKNVENAPHEILYVIDILFFHLEDWLIQTIFHFNRFRGYEPTEKENCMNFDNNVA